MKTNLFKGLKNYLFLPLFILVMFTSCQNEESDVTESNTEETFDANSVIAQSIFNITTFDGSYDNIIDSANCISVNLPVTVIVNGITITIESIDDYDLIEDIFDEFDDDENEIEIQFPITIILNDYTQIVINNYDELFVFIDECLGENEEDDDIECIDFQYPISISIFNSDFQVIDTVEINDDEELYMFIDELEGGVLASINFPVTMVLADGSTLEVQNNDELQAAIEAAEDACDEDDDNDWDDDDEIDCSVEEIELALQECVWNISAYNGDDNFNHYDLAFDPNYGFTVSENGNVVHDGTWSVSLDGEELFIDFQTSWQDLNGNWEIVGCDDDEFELAMETPNGVIAEIELEQECYEDEYSVSDVNNSLIECNWLIANLEVMDENITSEYSDYLFNFNEDGSFEAYNNGQVYDGTWIAQEITGGGIAVTIAGNGLTSDINDYYVLANLGDNSIELEGENGHYIKFERDCENDLECSVEDISAYLQECNWYSGTNLLSNDFNGPYTFGENGVVTVSNPNGNPITGTWNIESSDFGTFLVLDLPEPYNVISLEWKIVECNTDRLEMVNGDNSLVLEQDCSNPFECYSNTEMVICDDDVIDGFTAFDLNMAYPNCAEDNVEISFYETIADAEAQTNPLSSTHTNVSNPQTIYARVQLAGTNTFEVFEVELYVEDCSTEGCTEEQVDAYLMECHWVAVSYNGDNQLLGYNIYFNENMNLVVQGNGTTFNGTWSTAGNPANGVFLTIEQLPADLQDLIGQWQVVECTETQIILHDDNNVEIVLERDCNYSGCNEDQVNNFLLECTWNVTNYNNSDDLIIFNINFNNDGTMTITGDGQTITSMWSTSSNDDGVWLEFSQVNAGNIQAISGNWLVVECGEGILQLEIENTTMMIERTCP